MAIGNGAAPFDVAIVGGGAAGVAAALGAAHCGASVVLVERYGFLGGAATNASVLAYCGLFKQGPAPERCVAGAADVVLTELARLGQHTTAFRSPSTGNWILPLEAEPLKLALDRVLLRAGVALRLHSLVVDAERDRGTLKAVRVADHDGTHSIAAKAFVDASGEADLAARAGAGVITGGLDGHPLQAASMPLRIGGVPRGLAIDRARLCALVSAHNDSSPYPILRADGGIIIRLPQSEEVWWLVLDITTGGLGGADLSRAECVAREHAWAYVQSLRTHMPGFGDAYLIGTGPQLGIRETRHVVTRRQVTLADARDGVLRDDGVALAGWPMENHHQPGNPVYAKIGGSGVFHVPLDALRAERLDNLWCAGRVIGADASAFGSIRVMGTAFATGHAAGVAAALQARAGQAATASPVRDVLRAQGALL
jgi:glycine/D-amino acid oxidase-like deaminating enzyme